MFRNFESKLKVEDPNNYHQAYNPLLTLLFQAFKEVLEEALVEPTEEPLTLSSSNAATPSRTSSRESTSRTVLPNKCIFCNKGNYIKNCRNRERLSSCMQSQADETVRKIATQNDSKILAITTNDLITKEACYHFTCYRSYTRQNKVKEAKAQDEPGQDETEHSNISEVIKFFVKLYEKPDIIPLSTLQNMLSIKSERKNMKRNIENRTSNFKFVKSAKT